MDTWLFNIQEVPCDSLKRALDCVLVPVLTSGPVSDLGPRTLRLALLHKSGLNHCHFFPLLGKSYDSKTLKDFHFLNDTLPAEASEEELSCK